MGLGFYYLKSSELFPITNSNIIHGGKLGGFRQINYNTPTRKKNEIKNCDIGREADKFPLNVKKWLYNEITHL